MVQVLLNADRGIKHVFNLIFQLIDSEDPKFKVLKNNAQLLFGKRFFIMLRHIGCRINFKYTIFFFYRFISC